MTAAQNNSAISEAWGGIKVLSGDERKRALAEAREKARMDWDSYLGDARYEGVQEGMQKRLQKGKFEIAQNLLREKMPIETVAKLTGLTFEDVARIAADFS